MRNEYTNNALLIQWSYILLGNWERENWETWHC